MDTVFESFPPMRRRDRALSRDAAVQILEEGEYGVLATCGEDGWPYGVPLSYVYHEGKIYFHGAATGRKLSNLNACPRASFTVVGNTHVLQEIFSTAYYEKNSPLFSSQPRLKGYYEWLQKRADWLDPLIENDYDLFLSPQ